MRAVHHSRMPKKETAKLRGFMHISWQTLPKSNEKYFLKKHFLDVCYAKMTWTTWKSSNKELKKRETVFENNRIGHTHHHTGRSSRNFLSKLSLKDATRLFWRWWNRRVYCSFFSWIPWSGFGFVWHPPDEVSVLDEGDSLLFVTEMLLWLWICFLPKYVL